ncbi:phosphatidylglycerol:prolipoprotein diacylglycerol transferase [Rhizobium mesoamericanum]|uniref:prolipoprotein diacylglyceryl transferase n=1 Tax=Rhizobium mesoamericanum TaxID=1079800 RepID=UPI00278697FB|nr:prolipoprotein diacylglyceryl transferase [Rhizobium mesoamericanum]MDQ0562567.1 phosphatidylglycerol:prolipoprotein diacylglycerol transferase [Rhizobium mesoamericanum]
MPVVTNLMAAMPFPEIDPIAFSLGPLSVHWYGLAYVAGIMLGWYYARQIAGNSKLWPGEVSPITKLQLDDFIIWVALGIVLGGRIGYILFYDLPAVIERPVRAIQIWNGGMSFHGGLTGTTIAMIIFARRNSIPIWSLFDIVAAVVPIGLFCGRIANFINGELWGRLTDVPWGMVFCNQYIEKTNGYCPGGDFVRHPSQLYEAGLEGIVLLLVLALLIYRFRALKTPGFVTGVFVCGYALSRIFVEFFREPDAQLGYLLGTNWLTMGMVLSTPMVLLGIWAMLRARRQAAPQH